MKRFSFFIFLVLSVICVYCFSFIESKHVLLQVFGASAGSLLMVGLLAGCCFKTKLQYSDGLKILDWLLIAMDLSLMACFQLLGIEPILYWFTFVLLPSLGVRVVVGYYVKRMPKKVLIQDDAKAFSE